MSLMDYDEVELEDIQRAKKCMEGSFRKYGLLADDLDFQLEAEWIAEYTEALGSVDWLLVDEDKQLEYIPTITFLFWLSDKGYITDPQYKNPNKRVQMYIWHWGGYVGNIESTLKNVLHALEKEAEQIRNEIDKMIV